MAVCKTTRDIKKTEKHRHHGTKNIHDVYEYFSIKWRFFSYTLYENVIQSVVNMHKIETI